MKQVIAIGFALWAVCHSSIAAEFNYTESDVSGNNIALGYPVPLPVDSLTPVDGFRSYQSLDLRHQQITADSPFFERMAIGSTFNGRTIWAYQLSDGDNVNQWGQVEGSMLINGGIHAREWQTPEALTGYMEGFYQYQNDQHIYQYILENSNLVLIPVLNIDGFLQTQRYPMKVTDSAASPRDGRMRRKNMREVDELLSTTSDNLNGIDLNRNNAPYWATNSNRSSSDRKSIVHHGSFAGSEPETLALQQAAVLAGDEQLRFYTDTHSFSQIYYAPFTDNDRRNNITGRLANIMRAVNNFKYSYGPAPAGVGIGATDEYFAESYQIPSFTLELEPINSAQQYGGLGVSHDGFILPNAEVARMRQETLAAAVAGLYTMTDIPWLTELKITREEQVVTHLRWQLEDNQRVLNTLANEALVSEANYQLTLIFNKPMRAIVDQQVTGFHNLSSENGMLLSWLYKTSVEGEEQEISLDTANGRWLTEDYSRYQTDSYQVDFTFSADIEWQNAQMLALTVLTTDMTGQSLDANPATEVSWAQGNWQGFENSNGDSTTDLGGVDRSMRLIDDGSALFPETDSTPVPNPPPQEPIKSSGGGIVIWLLLLMLSQELLNQLKVPFSKYCYLRL